MTTTAPIELYPPGTEEQVWTPGDFLLTTSKGWVGEAIRFGQRLRWPQQYCWPNHAALVVDISGGLIEALAGGLEYHYASKYEPKQYAIVHTNMDEQQRLDALDWAWARYDEHRHYGWVTIVSEVISMITGAALTLGIAGEMICSGFVAGALEVAGRDLGPAPLWLPPAGLATMYKVPAP